MAKPSQMSSELSAQLHPIVHGLISADQALLGLIEDLQKRVNDLETQNMHQGHELMLLRSELMNARPRPGESS